MEVINRKDIKEVGTICFVVRIPMKKTKIFMEFFYLSFQKILIFGFKIFIETLLYYQKAMEQQGYCVLIGLLIGSTD